MSACVFIGLIAVESMLRESGEGWVDFLLVWYECLSVTSHINCIVVRCLINVVYQGMCLYHVMMTLHFLNDVANDTEWTQK